MSFKRAVLVCMVIAVLGALSSVAAGQVGSESSTTSAQPQAEPPTPTAVGTRIGDKIFYDGGLVAVTVGPAAFDDCPASWLCLWEHASFQGRMLQFQASGYWQGLAAYGFENMTSSWRNRRAVDARLGEGPAGGTNICVGNGSSSGAMGSWNDRVKSVYITNSSTIC